MAVGGRRYTERKAALKRRMLENPDAKATAAMGHGGLLDEALGALHSRGRGHRHR
jgi:hypothetical protein